MRRNYSFLLSESFYTEDIQAHTAKQALRQAIKWWIQLSENKKVQLGQVRNYYQTCSLNEMCYKPESRMVYKLPKVFIYRDLGITFDTSKLN